MRLSPGQVADCTQALALLGNDDPAAIVIGDKAYDTDAIVTWIKAGGGVAVIPSRSHRKTQRPLGPQGLCKPQSRRAVLRQKQGVPQGRNALRQTAPATSSPPSPSPQHAASCAISHKNQLSPQPRGSCRQSAPERSRGAFCASCGRIQGWQRSIAEGAACRDPRKERCGAKWQAGPGCTMPRPKSGCIQRFLKQCG